MDEKAELDINIDIAIKVEKASIAYSNGKKTSPILRDLDLEVPRGKIYGLLGPSGCGKTTLLKCMLGKLALDSGRVDVFGSIPGCRSTGVPGKRVGYMPQELALFEEFNIAETLEYFSRLYGMSREKFQERMEFLLNFLDLPSKSRPLEKMSGGQQRRASLAVALLHEPDLLILDEPTVGVDPLLRQSIWNHLVELSSSSTMATTIVITTHYTEEAMQAHTVGMMRFGRLLAEGSPQNLLLEYDKISLEDVFLELCMKDNDFDALGDEIDGPRASIIKPDKNQGSEEKSFLTQNNQSTVISLTNEKGILLAEKREKSSSELECSVTTKPAGKINTDNSELTLLKTNFSFPIVSACMSKTFNRMKKRWGFLIYTFILPALQVSLFCLAIGQDPKDLPLGIVTDEVNTQMGECEHNKKCPLDKNSFFGTVEPNMDLANLSCRYLEFLDKDMIRPVMFDEVEDAISAVESGATWGVVYMDRNFSLSLYQKVFDSMTCVDKEGCSQGAGGSIRIRLDVTNQQLAFTLQLKLVEAFQKFLAQLVDSCDFPPDMASIPLVFDNPIYGTSQLTFTDFMAPGIILTIVHSMALGFSAMIIIIERNEGLLDRTWVAGVKPSEFALAHFICSVLVNLGQVVLTLGFMLAAFRIQVVGSYFLLFLMTLLQGMCGTTIGLIISSVCKTQQDATQIALGIFYPNMILSGILWPLEAMPVVLRYVAYVLPQTLACEAMRSVLMRGWGIDHPVVARGFIVTLIWICITYLIFKLKIHKYR